ncbi:MAG: ribose ABC transporter permease, partial [Oscillospiraceae bacterium]|nr:ribose ABC transporter permease [Oscillospiraceae bacterium]
MGNVTEKAPEKKSWTSYISEYGAFIALIFLVLLISIISPDFRTAGNFLNLLRQATFNGLIAFGMTCVILSDGIDLSVGSTLALSAVICAKLMTSGVPAMLAMPVALIVGTLLGVVSGLLVTKGRLQPFIATLITMTAYRGFAMILTDGKPISRLAEIAGSKSNQ